MSNTKNNEKQSGFFSCENKLFKLCEKKYDLLEKKVLKTYFSFNEEKEVINKEIQKIVQRQTKFARQAEFDDDHDNLVSIVRL